MLFFEVLLAEMVEKWGGGKLFVANSILTALVGLESDVISTSSKWLEFREHIIYLIIFSSKVDFFIVG